MKELTWADALSKVGDYQGYHIESIPNGIVTDHIAVFEYTRGFIRLSSAAGRMVIALEMK